MDSDVLDNAQARQIVAKSVEPIAQGLIKLKVTPDAVTWTGALGTVGISLGLLSQGHLLVGGILIALLSASDLLDGTMARLQGSQGAWGAFLDSTLDRVSDASVICAIIYYYSQSGQQHSQAAVSAGLVSLVMGLLTSYARARAEGLGVDCKVGIAERAERSIILLTALILTGLGLDVLPRGLILLAVVSTITVGQRMWHVRKLLAS